MDFKDRLREALLAVGFPDRGMAQQLSVIMQVSPKAVGKWLNGESMPTTTKIATLAKLAKINGEWLLTGIGEKSQSAENNNVSSLHKELKLIPVISWVQAGQFCEVIDNFSPGDADEWIPCPTPGASSQTYALKVIGDSMTNPYPGQRSYPEGTVIFVDPNKPYENGSRVVAKDPTSGEATFKQYIEDAGHRYLKPLNPQYKIIEITGETYICGVVIGSYQNE
ncbi:MAG: XRE family transcriptional regulator [Pseudomonadota bacterium]